MSSSWAEFIAAVGASTVTLAALVLVLMALAHLSLRQWIKRKARQDNSGVNATPMSDFRLNRWLTRASAKSCRHSPSHLDARTLFHAEPADQPSRLVNPR